MSFLLNKKQLNLLNSIESGQYPFKIAQKASMSYCYALKTLWLYEQLGLVTSAKHGNIRLTKLTKKGENLKKNLLVIQKLLNNGMLK